MKQNKITWLILNGMKENRCLPEKWVDRAREAMIFDLIEKIRDMDLIGSIIVSSNDEGFLNRVSSIEPGVIPDLFKTGSSFHFGRWLAERVEKYRPRSLFYWGGGASPLISREILESICVSVVSGNNILYTNNFYSADWTAFTPASAALDIPCPPMDNNLAYWLWRERGLRSIYLEPSVEIVGDVDTPADLMVLKEIPKTGINLGEYLNKLEMDTARVKRIIELLKDRNRIYLSGRVGSSLFKYLDTRCLCSFRVISEERGMRSTGREKNRQVESIQAKMIEIMGLKSFFEYLESICDGAIIDSRVIFANVAGHVATEDRFLSDLGDFSGIKNPFVKDFTKYANEASIPVLTGGHSLILGGLWAMVSSFGELPVFY